MVMPKPTAGPLMAAMTGFFISKMRKRHQPAAVAVVLGALRAPGAARERPAAAPEVRARAEGAAGAGDDHRPHVVVAIGLVEGRHQLADRGRVDGVEPVRPVQRERRDAVRDVVQECLERHSEAEGPDALARTGRRGLGGRRGLHRQLLQPRA